LQLTSPSTSPNELNTTLTPHSIIHGDAYFAYFNKIWGIPGGSHYKVLSTYVGGILMIPARRPIKAVYIRTLVALADTHILAKAARSGERK
jgi:hypothetical protein